jgi:hypothetical protein
MDPITLHARFETDVDDVYLRTPMHVTRRIAALIPFASEIHYVDFGLVEQSGKVSGEVVVIADGQVVHAKLTESPKSPAEGAPSTVHIAAWTLSKLTRTAIHADPESNSDYTRDRDWSGRWTMNATVTLHFESDLDATSSMTSSLTSGSTRRGEVAPYFIESV